MAQKQKTKWYKSEEMKVLYLLLFGLGFSGILIGIACLFEKPSRERCISQMEKHIEKMNFVEAREYLVYYYEHSQSLFGGVSESEYLEYRNKICRAQVNSLIMDGNFDVAIQVANDDENGDYYAEIYVAHLQAIYEQLPRNQFFVGLSKIPYLSCESEIRTFNSAIEQLCILLKTTGRQQEIEPLLYYLREYAEGDSPTATRRISKQIQTIKQRFKH